MRTGLLQKAPPTTHDVMTLHVQGNQKHVVAMAACQIHSNTIHGATTAECLTRTGDKATKRIPSLRINQTCLFTLLNNACCSNYAPATEDSTEVFTLLNGCFICPHPDLNLTCCCSHSN
ncbi:hypothetical protein AMELA_G00180230 [Ameiurus melas]|uniref:Uncharacterized protein n=1 Tax=Ameiurus melas TaxID=219545 RepID=A0A7J6A9P8_AMEME|nr:hypothetical protein AMELA_G00180230 [Ameiurus melas]